MANLLGDENQIPHPHIKLPKSMGNPNYHMYTVTVEHFFRDTCHFLKNSMKKVVFFVQIYALFQLTVSLPIPSGCIFAVVNTELIPKLCLRVFTFTCLYLDHSRLQNILNILDHFRTFWTIHGIRNTHLGLGCVYDRVAGICFILHICYN